MYQTLYRKYRPRVFSDVVGQDVIIQTLSNSIKNKKISHAYLFIGPRGTGKTSTAKIFARAANCNHFDNDLCGKCEMCDVSADRDCLDIIEIDAASNNGVDEIRGLREKVVLVPNKLKYKVYIIDEVHMLTIQAFNALLKTLEEPPEHVIFILATTDPQKVPETIISRCQCYNFSRISEECISQNLLAISKKEDINVELDVLNQIAIISDGGMRDSIGMLDKLSCYSNNKISINDFLSLNGLVTSEKIHIFIQNVFDNNVFEIINTLEKWNANGKNLIQIMIYLLDYLKNILVDKYTGKNSENLNIDNYQNFANLLNEKLFDIKRSSNPKIYIEIMILNFMNNISKTENISREIIVQKGKENNIFQNVPRKTIGVSETKIVENIDTQQQRKIVVNIETDNNIANSNIKKIMEIRVNNTFVSATKAELNRVKNEFNKLNEYIFDQNFGYLVCALLEGKLRLANSKLIVLSYEYESVVLNNLVNIKKMEKLLTEILGMENKLALVSDSDWNIYANKYLENMKNSKIYEYTEEPKLMFDKKREKKDIKDSISTTFGDIVEIA